VTAFSSGRLSHVYFGGYRRSGGYRDNADLERFSLSGKWLYSPSAGGWALSVMARGYDFDTQAPGYLTPAEVAANPRQSPAFSATDGGRQQTRHIGLHLDRQFSGALALSFKAYRQAFEQQRWVQFTAAGSQQERLEDETQTGALVTLTWRPRALASRDTTLSSGADVQVQDNIARRYRTMARSRGTLLRDQAFDFWNGGAYAMADTRPVSWLRVNGGVRADRVGGDFTDGLTGAQLPAIDYGTIWQPKVGATAIVREGVTLYGNYGRSFQVGVGAAAYSRTRLDHSKNDGWEAGIHLTLVPGLIGRVGVWGQDASDELRLKFDNSGDSENVGRTRRRGWNIEVTAKPHPTIFVWGTYTRQRATLVEPGSTQPGLRGHELNHVPHYTAKAGIDVTPSRVVSVSLWTEAQGDYYLTPANTPDRFGGRRLTNVDAFVRLRRTVTLGAHVKNLFNGYHEYAWFDGATTLHSPGEPRSFSVTSTLGF
jgi:iron complex outermembrane receptor protein